MKGSQVLRFVGLAEFRVCRVSRVFGVCRV